VPEHGEDDADRKCAADVHEERPPREDADRAPRDERHDAVARGRAERATDEDRGELAQFSPR
jgi:hypothetical protein